jgi:hypothetical protein
MLQLIVDMCVLAGLLFFHVECRASFNHSDLKKLSARSVISDYKTCIKVGLCLGLTLYVRITRAFLYLLKYWLVWVLFEILKINVCKNANVNLVKIALHNNITSPHKRQCNNCSGKWIWIIGYIYKEYWFKYCF